MRALAVFLTVASIPFGKSLIEYDGQRTLGAIQLDLESRSELSGPQSVYLGDGVVYTGTLVVSSAIPFIPVFSAGSGGVRFDGSTVRVESGEVRFGGVTFEAQAAPVFVSEDARVVFTNCTFLDTVAFETDAAADDVRLSHNYWGDAAGPQVSPGRKAGGPSVLEVRTGETMQESAYAPWYVDEDFEQLSTSWVVSPERNSEADDDTGDVALRVVAGEASRLVWSLLDSSCSGFVSIPSRAETVDVVLPQKPPDWASCLERPVALPVSLSVRLELESDGTVVPGSQAVFNYTLPHPNCRSSDGAELKTLIPPYESKLSLADVVNTLKVKVGTIAAPSALAARTFLCGDLNSDGSLQLADIINMLRVNVGLLSLSNFPVPI